MVYIGQSAEVDHLLQVPPGTHEQQLALDEVLLLLGSIGQLVDILQTEIHLTDDVPGMLQGVGKLVGRGRVQIGGTAVQIALVVVVPVTVVAQVEVCCHVCVATAGIHQLVLTPVEGAAPIVRLLVGNAVVSLLYKTLEVREVHERHLRVHVRVGGLVQIVGARSGSE